MYARVTIVVVTFNAARHVKVCLDSVAGAGVIDRGAELIVVDNASSDGTAERVREEYPWATLIESDHNLGFAGGSNLGIRRALESGAEFVYLLNPDTEVDREFLARALAVAEADPRAAAVQSLILLAAERDRINTAGNEIHFLGFGYCAGLNEHRATAPATTVEVGFASGAAVLLSAAALRDVGLFDQDLFLYLEDLDLGWRLRLAGYRSVLAPRSIVWHRYEFSRNHAKYYYLERNRYLVLAKNLRFRSLLVLAPFLVASEAGLLVLAAISGWLPQKICADAHLLRRSTWRHIWRERSRVAALRRRNDREVAEIFTATLAVEGVSGEWLPAMLRAPMELAWRAIRLLLA